MTYVSLDSKFFLEFIEGLDNYTFSIHIFFVFLYQSFVVPADVFCLPEVIISGWFMRFLLHYAPSFLRSFLSSSTAVTLLCLPYAFETSPLFVSYGNTSMHILFVIATFVVRHWLRYQAQPDTVLSVTKTHYFDIPHFLCDVQGKSSLYLNTANQHKHIYLRSRGS